MFASPAWTQPLACVVHEVMGLKGGCISIISQSVLKKSDGDTVPCCREDHVAAATTRPTESQVCVVHKVCPNAGAQIRSRSASDLYCASI